MAHQVLVEQDTPQPQSKKVIRVVERIVEKTKEILPKFIDSVVLITICFWYFLFTGLAILFRSPIPKEWLRVATYLSRGKVAKKIQEMNYNSDAPKKLASHRVVDIESKNTIPIAV